MTRNLVAVVMLMAAACGATAEDKKSPLEGKWLIESVTRDGKADDDFKGATRVHEGDKYKMTAAEGKKLPTSEGKYTYDADKKTLDLKPSGGRYEGKTLQGIYKIDGETLTIAFTEPGKERPSKFESKEGSGVVLAVMKKAK